MISRHTVCGSRIEEYRVFELLGKGGFAQVYRAQCRRSGLAVAVKMIEKALMASAKMVGRVRQEVTIHSRLKHPSILELFTFFEDAHYVYLILELAHNGALATHFQLGDGGLGEDTTASILRQVVAGVLYLHSHQILHRDLSLNNLLVTKDLKVKIADFGLATQLNEPDEKHMTMCGTPNFISPEVASRSHHGLPADVWGLGCLLYTLLVGKAPFDTHNVKNTLDRVIRADYHIPRGLSREARDLLDRLLRKNPAERISLNQVVCHPFLSSGDSKSEFRKDSGFDMTLQTTQSTQHHRTRSEDRLPSASYDTPLRPRLDNFITPDSMRPASFNALSGIRGNRVIGNRHNVRGSNDSLNFNENDYGRLPNTDEHNFHLYRDFVMETSEANCKSNQELAKDQRIPTSARGDVKKNENKENVLPGTRTIGVPPLCAARLTKVPERIGNTEFTISANGTVTVHFIKRRGRLGEERITEVCIISKDGMQIVVYSVCGGKGCPVTSSLPPHTPTPQEIFTYHNLPRKYWKKYLYAARFVDVVKAKTPKITFYSNEAKCFFMENGTDFEGFFYNGAKITVTAANGVKIIDQNRKTHRETKNLETCANQIYVHFQECMKRCLEVESALHSLSEECFPLIMGVGPNASQGPTLVSQISQQITPITGGSIGLFSNVTGSAASRTDTMEKRQLGDVPSFGTGQLRTFNPYGERNVPFISSINSNKF